MAKYYKKKKLTGLKASANIMLSSAMVAGFVYLCATSLPIKVHELPDVDSAYSAVYSDVGGEEYAYLKGARMVCPQKYNEIKINVLCELDDVQKAYLSDAVSEINAVFEVINPNYRFELNFSPTKQDINNKFYINVDTENLNRKIEQYNEFKMGEHTSQKLEEIDDTADPEQYRSYILLDNTNFGPLANVSYLGNVFRHELLHALGLDDAYKIEGAPAQSIMQSATPARQTLAEIDVKLLYNLYYVDGQSPYSREEVLIWISNYEQFAEKYNTHKKIINLQQESAIKKNMVTTHNLATVADEMVLN